MILAHKKDY